MDRLEEKRKVKAQAFHERKVSDNVLPCMARVVLTGAQTAALKLRQKALADATPSFEKLVQLGY